jgi:hypothetical protein
LPPTQEVPQQPVEGFLFNGRWAGAFSTTNGKVPILRAVDQDLLELVVQEQEIAVKENPSEE